MTRLVMFQDSKWILLCSETLQTIASGDDFYTDKVLDRYKDAEALAAVNLASARELLIAEHQRQQKDRAH